MPEGSSSSHRMAEAKDRTSSVRGERKKVSDLSDAISL